MELGLVSPLADLILYVLASSMSLKNSNPDSMFSVPIITSPIYSYYQDYKTNSVFYYVKMFACI